MINSLCGILNNNIMKPYHLTILRNGKYETLFGEFSTIAMFISIERKLGRETHIIYSRRLTEEEYKIAKHNNL